MKKISFIALFLAIISFGCSSTKTETSEPAHAETEAASESAQQPAIVLPFEIDIVGNTNEDGVRMDVIVTYNTDIQGEPMLEIEPNVGTSLGQKAKVMLPAGKAGKVVTQSFALIGESPSAKAVVRYTENGFGVEVHETYPIGVELQRKARNDDNFDLRSPLPAPIQVDDQTITQGVEVNP